MKAKSLYEQSPKKVALQSALHRVDACMQLSRSFSFVVQKYFQHHIFSPAVLAALTVAVDHQGRQEINRREKPRLLHRLEYSLCRPLWLTFHDQRSSSSSSLRLRSSHRSARPNQRSLTGFRLPLAQEAAGPAQQQLKRQQRPLRSAARWLLCLPLLAEGRGLRHRLCLPRSGCRPQPLPRWSLLTKELGRRGHTAAAAVLLQQQRHISSSRSRPLLPQGRAAAQAPRRPRPSLPIRLPSTL